MVFFTLDIAHERQTVFAIIIEKENLERMREGDPITLESRLKGGLLPAPSYPQNFSLLIAYLEDTQEFYELAKSTRSNPVELLKYLEQHRQWKPGVDGVEHARIVR